MPMARDWACGTLPSGAQSGAGPEGSAHSSCSGPLRAKTSRFRALQGLAFLLPRPVARCSGFRREGLPNALPDLDGV